MAKRRLVLGRGIVIEDRPIDARPVLARDRVLSEPQYVSPYGTSLDKALNYQAEIADYDHIDSL
jgi:hypothetical protein